MEKARFHRLREGKHIPTLVQKLQTQVRKDVEYMTGMVVKKRIILMAGVAGLEPANAGFRIQCLTNLAIALYEVPLLNHNNEYYTENFEKMFTRIMDFCSNLCIIWV